MSAAKRFRLNRSWIIGCIASICCLWSTGWSAKVVYPWRATTAIVEAGKTFDVWFVADSGQTINSVQLQGPYNTVNTTISQTSGSWTYDKISGNTYNRKIVVTVPAGTPEDRYNLVVKTSTGDVISKSAVKVLKQYLSSYYIVHISDAHRYQSGYNADNILKRVSKILDYANIMDAQIVLDTGDMMYGVNNTRLDAMYDGVPASGFNGMFDCFAATFCVSGNHDNPTAAAANFDADWAATFHNANHGLTYYNFVYGNARYMAIANSISADWTMQVNDAKAWLNTVGNGNLRVGTYHSPTGSHNDYLKAQTDYALGIAGHTHSIGNNPYKNNTYVASDLRSNFQFNLYKIDNNTGAISLPAGVDAGTDAIFDRVNDKDNPAAWELKLMLNYARTNNGTSISNSATITNKFNFPIDGARIRFVMPKGNTYSASKGTIQQQFDGTTYRIVDVKVDVPALSTVAVTISVSPINQVSVPNVINQTEAAAKSTIINAGLTVSGVSSNFHADVPAGLIYSQTPGAGTLVASNSSVALAVSKGPSNQPPSFVSDPFSMPAATEGAAYSQSISGKATDPEGGALTYSKVSGPAWLTVSSTGALTGTPGATDGGNNSFSVKVTDNAALTDTATMTITVNRTTTTVPWVTNLTEAAAGAAITNAGLTVSSVSLEFNAMAAGRVFSQTPGGNNAVAIGSSVALAVSKGPSNQPPYFTSNPFAIADATVGTAYSQSISASAVDPEGTTKTYSKVSGPAWLNIATSGAVTGTPGSADVGTNSFSVSVTDAGGVSATATMTVVVKSAITIPVVSFIAPTNLTVQVGSTLYVNVSATDPDGISVVRLYKDGVQLARTEGAAPYEWNAAGQSDVELQNLQAGSFVLTARATDSAGSMGEASVTINVVGGIPSIGSIVTLKAVNGKYVSANNNTTNYTLIANKTTLSNYERFKVVNATNGVGLQCMGNNLFVSIAVPNGSKAMKADRPTMGSYERFNLVQSGTNIAIQSTLSTNYVSAVSNGVAPLQANQTYIGSYEKFTWKVE